MENKYEEGSTEWALMEAAKNIAEQQATDDPTADAIDRLTVAIYRIGAAFVGSSDFIARQLAQVAESIEMKSD